VEYYSDAGILTELDGMGPVEDKVDAVSELIDAA
jgi:hypothetical protein